MKLSDFIRQHAEELIKEWEDCSYSNQPAHGFRETVEFRGYAKKMLFDIAEVLDEGEERSFREKQSRRRHHMMARASRSAVKNDVFLHDSGLSFHDISPIKRTEARLIHLAHHDALTGLPNRILYNASLEKALVRNQRQNKYVALMFLDLDRFKRINDTMGHAVGDQLLQTVAHRLKQCVRAEDTVSRLGGDEFTIILENLTQQEDAALLAKNNFHYIKTH